MLMDTDLVAPVYCSFAVSQIQFRNFCFHHQIMKKLYCLQLKEKKLRIYCKQTHNTTKEHSITIKKKLKIYKDQIGDNYLCIRVEEVENSFDNWGCHPSIGDLVAGSNLHHNTLLHPGNSEGHHANTQPRSRGHTLDRGHCPQR